MKQSARHLTEVVEAALPMLLQVTEEQAGARPAEGKWSKKEIIGHLIDSAGNNQMKFIRAIMEDGVRLNAYAQDDWVRIQQYQKEGWKDLLQLWSAYNRHLAHLMRYIPDTVLGHTLYIGNSRAFTLEFIVMDYVEHLKHHLQAVLPGEPFLENRFEMVY